MTKTHEPKKIVFCPTNIETSYDEDQWIWFVNLETEPFDYEDKFPVKNPQTGKLEEKIETRKFSAEEKTDAMTGRKSNTTVFLAIGGTLFLGVILGLLWQRKKRQRLFQL
ncbi:MAG: hypothetical protein MRERV_59c006 [Mycoplasmataceae bacterium RV_VA103A]|nr:MAG: hypothetical protein MRERV_59c006 [Mycoplasmataceae bacterium RV_VA103A]